MTWRPTTNEDIRGSRTSLSWSRARAPSYSGPAWSARRSAVCSAGAGSSFTVSRELPSEIVVRTCRRRATGPRRLERAGVLTMAGRGLLQLRVTLPPTHAAMTGVKWSCDGSLLAGPDQRGTLRLWRYPDLIPADE